MCVLASIQCLGSCGPLPQLFSSLAHCCTCEGRLKGPNPGLRFAISCSSLVLELQAGRTCHDQCYEISLLPYCCGVRPSAQSRSGLSSNRCCFRDGRHAKGVRLCCFALLCLRQKQMSVLQSIKRVPVPPHSLGFTTF